MQPPHLPHPRDVASLEPLLSGHPLGRFKLAGYLREEEDFPHRCWVDEAVEPRGVIMESRGRYSVLAANDEAMRRLLEAIDWSAEVRFAAFPKEFLSVLTSVATVIDANEAFLYSLESENFTPRISHPVRSLTDDDASLVAQAWDYSDDVGYCRARIAAAPAVGAEIAGELAAFIITHADGSMGILHTRTELRRHGLGRAVTSALARELLDQGRRVYCFIVNGNEPSMRLFESLGFRRRASCSWLLAAHP